jgi:hypothetical protein
MLLSISSRCHTFPHVNFAILYASLICRQPSSSDISVYSCEVSQMVREVIEVFDSLCAMHAADCMAQRPQMRCKFPQILSGAAAIPLPIMLSILSS